MWQLILAGLLATAVCKDTEVSSASKSSSDDVVLLEIDVKDPSKRSPVSATGVYGASSPSQFIIRHGDDAQELSPEYLSLVEQYTSAQPQPYSQQSRAGPPPRRLPAYARQQQNLQQAYQNQRVPAVAPPRPRLTLHPQAEAQADAHAEYQAQLDAHNRAEANALLRASGTSHAEYQVPTGYGGPKLGTFEQELLQLVSANQAQEFKLQQTQPKRLPKPQGYNQYSQQLLAYPGEYDGVKPTAEPIQESPNHQQYHIETTQPRYQAPQHVPVAYRPLEEVQHQQQAQQSYAQPRKPYRPAPQYVDPAVQQAHAQAEAVAQAQAQAQAEAQALAYQKVSQASHLRHQQAALEQIRIVEDRFKQQSALEQINQGHVSEAGREHIEEQVRPKDPEAAYRANLKAQAAAEAAEARRAQEAAEYKAHGDAIIALQRQQAAHLKAQEDAHIYALNFEKNQAKAQAQAQALANAQALALWKAHQSARAKAQKEAQLAARAQDEARKRDPEHTPVIQYLLPTPNSTPLPPNSYLTNDQVNKYQASGSSYVPRAAVKPDEVNQPRQAHKHKIPNNSQIYVSQSGLRKKAPVKSLTIEEIIEQDQERNSQIIRIPAAKAQPLTQADLDALIHAGYTVTPVPEVTRPTQPSYALENTTGYYVKKQTARPEAYVNYDDIPRHQRRPVRRQRPILKQEAESEGSDKVTYLVPLDSTYGDRRPQAQRRIIAEE
ncbi:mediator of RNA polymerase II transcription subunit 15 [Fopius arisanus]|uniref:Mediator of RNA polymerase II transcription subunit 15 n=2 Tax=Fopius arisanus TaxID=64838 RepID=A0A9R1SYQ9_9HYME|nr:PREDICTED: mediator of RNA polymerase II transcription subunit 15-like [Fopius arisanus]